MALAALERFAVKLKLESQNYHAAWNESRYDCHEEKQLILLRNLYSGLAKMIREANE